MATTVARNPLSTPVTNTEKNNILLDHIFSDLQEPDISAFISVKYPQYGINAFLDRLNRKQGTPNNEFFWFEYGFFRKALTIGAGSTLAAAATIVVKVLNTTVAAASVLVNDTIKFENDQIGRVTIVAQNSADVDITVVNQTGNNWTSGGDYPVPVVGEKFTQAFTAFGEYSDAPDSRIYNPEKLTQYLTILRKTATISTSAYAHKVWASIKGKKVFWFDQEEIAMQQLAQDKEMLFMFGVQSSGTLQTGATQSGYGIIPRIKAKGVNLTYTGDISEDDLMEMVRLLIVNGNGTTKEMFVPCGSRFLKGVQSALQKYFINGSGNFGAFSDKMRAGLNIMSYDFMGLKLNFMQYYPFDNPTLLPAPATAGNIDYSTAAVFLNMGERGGVPLIQERYLQDADGTSYSFIRKLQPGMSDPGSGLNKNIAVTAKDGFSVLFLANVGIEIRVPEAHGICYRG